MLFSKFLQTFLELMFPSPIALSCNKPNTSMFFKKLSLKLCEYCQNCNLNSSQLQFVHQFWPSGPAVWVKDLLALWVLSSCLENKRTIFPSLQQGVHTYASYSNKAHIVPPFHSQAIHVPWSSYWPKFATSESWWFPNQNSDVIVGEIWISCRKV